MKIFIIHGSYGNPDENWFPWLRKELEKLGHTVLIPEFSTPKNQNLKQWMFEFQDYGQWSNIDDDTIFIGHSLGPAFILSILEELEIPKPIKACYFVSGWIGMLGNKFDNIIKTFVDKEFNWKKIKTNCEKFIMYNSDNDPYVSLDKAVSLANKLGIKINVINGAGHINKEAGYTKFENLLEDIKNIS